uniref:Putative secreted protein n=1 Tax=Anopheles darlingi TaxID=43151 RepID=A0A2M4D7I5_ANODA
MTVRVVTAMFSVAVQRGLAAAGCSSVIVGSSSNLPMKREMRRVNPSTFDSTRFRFWLTRCTSRCSDLTRSSMI